MHLERVLKFEALNLKDRNLDFKNVRCMHFGATHS